MSLGLVAGLLLVGGCASPGRPLPPSLRLPAPVTDLHAERIGDKVRLSWTTPSAATDGVPLKGTVTTELCRDVVPGVAASGAGSAASGAAAACTVVQTVNEMQGPSTVEDALPANLTAEPAGAMVYRVRLLNAAGHSAGVSNAALAASGRAPGTLTGLTASSDVRGVRLQWGPGAGPGAAIEILRTDLSAKSTGAVSVGGSRPGGTGRAKHGRGPVTRGGSSHGGATAPRTDRGVQQLVVDAGEQDPGGAIDPTAQRDQSYRYVLTRVRTVRVAGQSLTLRGPAAAEVLITMKDLQAPAVPKELVAAADGLSVDLSWEPDVEADLAGYRVYRAETPGGGGALAALPPAGPWRRVNEVLLGTPSFHDVVPRAGRYRYRVTAVDSSGNESQAGNAADVLVEMSPGQQP